MGDHHGHPVLCPYWVSCKCHLHVSQLYLPPTTSSRLVLASGVTAMSVLSHSTTTILEAAASLVFILTYSFRIQIINFSVSRCCPHTHSHSLSHKHTVHQVLISCCHWSELEMKLYSCSLDNLDPQRGWLLKFEIWKLRETITQNHHLTSFSELCLPAHRCISLSGGR